MVEILHQLIGGLSHYLQRFIHPRWCRISSINSLNDPTGLKYKYGCWRFKWGFSLDKNESRYLKWPWLGVFVSKEFTRRTLQSLGRFPQLFNLAGTMVPLFCTQKCVGSYSGDGIFSLALGPKESKKVKWIGCKSGWGSSFLFAEYLENSLRDQ